MRRPRWRALAHLLAEISIIVNGPEPAGTKWSYHDLPKKVRALAAQPAAGEVRPFGYAVDVDPADHEYSHTLYVLGPGEEVPEGATALYRDTPAAQPAAGDGMLPDALVPVSKEWYELCERAPHADKIKISGELAEAIVKAVSADRRRAYSALTGIPLNVLEGERKARSEAAKEARRKENERNIRIKAAALGYRLTKIKPKTGA